MVKLYDLFGKNKEDEESSRKDERQVRFETVMAPYLLQINSAYEDAFIAMNDELEGRSPSYKNHLSKPNRMNEQIKGKLTEIFGSKVRKLPYNRFGLFLEGYVFLFKKLDRFGRPSNVKTKNSLAMTGQSKLNYPGQPEIIHIGYFTNDWEQLNSILAVKIEDQAIQWTSDLRSVSTYVIGQQDHNVIETDASELGIKPKAKNRNKGTG